MKPLSTGSLIEYGVKALGFEVQEGMRISTEMSISGVSVLVYPAEIDILDETIPKHTILIVTASEHHGGAAQTSGKCSQIIDIAKTNDSPLIIWAQGDKVPAYLQEFTQKHAVPLIRSDRDPFYIKSRIIAFLREKIESIKELHGVLVQVFGIGVLITGESGIGKSECGLELLTRGHKLIADDLVEFHGSRESGLTGRSPVSITHLMEIRGLGIINVKQLFGAVAVIDETSVRVVVELVRWETEDGRMHLITSEQCTFRILDVDVPCVRVPVRPGGNMATFVEIVARRELFAEGGKEVKSEDIHHWRGVGSKR